MDNVAATFRACPERERTGRHVPAQRRPLQRAIVHKLSSINVESEHSEPLTSHPGDPMSSRGRARPRDLALALFNEDVLRLHHGQ